MWLAAGSRNVNNASIGAHCNIILHVVRRTRDWKEGVLSILLQKPAKTVLIALSLPGYRTLRSIVSNLSQSHWPTIHAFSLLFLVNSLPVLILSSMLSRSLSSFNLVIMTLLGAMPSGTLCPFDFSRVTRSTWMTYLRR